MPHYELHLDAVGDDVADRARFLLDRHYPEIEILGERIDGQHRRVWTCRAPARWHVERFAAELARRHIRIRDVAPG